MAKRKMRSLFCLIVAAAMFMSTIPFASADRTRGDINNDGEINVVDALLAMQICVGTVEADEETVGIADVNFNGEVDSTDALIILQYAVKYISALPVETLSGYIPVDEKNYYCYNNITPLQREIYDSMETAAQNFTAGEVLLPTGSYKSDIKVAYSAMRFDHPEIFWVPYSYTLFYFPNQQTENPLVGQFAFDYPGYSSYLFDQATAQTMSETLDRQSRAILESILKPGMTEGQRAEAIHDYIVKNSSYNTEAAAEKNAEKIYPNAFSAYGIIVEKKGVCEAFSRAYQYLCYRCGVLSTLISGTRFSDLEAHMWNAVSLDGDWYMTDTTWDNSSDYAYKTFENQTTEIFLLSHKIYQNISDLTGTDILSGTFNINAPECTATAENYFHKNGLYFEDVSDVTKNLPEKLAETVLNGGNSIQLMIKDVSFSSTNQAASYIQNDMLIETNRLLHDSGKLVGRYSYGFIDNSNCMYITV